MTVAVDFAAALVGLRPPDAAAKSKRPAFSKPRQRSTQNPRGAVQITGASSELTDVQEDGHEPVSCRLTTAQGEMIRASSTCHARTLSDFFSFHADELMSRMGTGRFALQVRGKQKNDR